jgi:Tfp pilus assembly protein PilP
MRFRLIHWVMIGSLLLAVAACGLFGGDKKEEAATDAQKAADEKVAEIRKAQPAKPGEVKAPDVKVAATAAQILEEPGLQYQYDPINKPDPFRPYSPTTDLEGAKADNPLLKFEVRYFKLVGVIRSTENPLAIFEDPSGRSYTVHIGDLIGKNGGVVRAILDDAVVVTETRISWRTEGTETVEMTIRLRPEDQTS